MTRTLTLLCSMLVLGGCLTRRTEEFTLNETDADPSTNPDGGGGSNNNGNGDANNGNGSSTGGEPLFCTDDKVCDTPELPFCDEEADACATCRNGSDCAPFAGRKACVKDEGCFECNGEKAGECGSAKPLCDPKKHACVECTAEMTDGCSLQGKVCEVETGSCVECTASADCASRDSAKCDTSANTCGKCEANVDCAHFADTPYCDVTAGACVGCLSNANCNDPAASQCDDATHQCTACASNTDCLHVAEGGDNLPLCVNAKCVECTRADKAECGSTGVCNALNNRCADGVALNSAVMCDACVSDEQCQLGQRCVQTTYGTGATQTEGWFCQWVPKTVGTDPGPATCSLVRPFVSQKLRSSIDGSGESPLCLHAVASCGAYRAFRTSCGRYESATGVIHVDDFADPDLPDDVEAKPETATAISADDGVCGVGGKCETLNSTNGAYRCSHACLAGDDCKAGSTCTLGNNDRCTVN